MPTLSRRDLKNIQAVLLTTFTADTETAQHLRSAREAVERALHPSEKRRAAKAKTKAAKKSKREAKADIVAKNREALLARSGGRCEMMFKAFKDDDETRIQCGSAGVEPHHYLGKKKAPDTPEFQLWVCRYDHDRLHALKPTAVEAWGDVVATLETLKLPTERAKKRLADALYVEGTKDRYEALR